MNAVYFLKIFGSIKINFTGLSFLKSILINHLKNHNMISTFILHNFISILPVVQDRLEIITVVFYELVSLKIQFLSSFRKIINYSAYWCRDYFVTSFGLNLKCSAEIIIFHVLNNCSGISGR